MHVVLFLVILFLCPLSPMMAKPQEQGGGRRTYAAEKRAVWDATQKLLAESYIRPREADFEKGFIGVEYRWDQRDGIDVPDLVDRFTTRKPRGAFRGWRGLAFVGSTIWIREISPGVVEVNCEFSFRGWNKFAGDYDWGATWQSLASNGTLETGLLWALETKMENLKRARSNQEQIFEAPLNIGTKPDGYGFRSLPALPVAMQDAPEPTNETARIRIPASSGGVPLRIKVMGVSETRVQIWVDRKLDYDGTLLPHRGNILAPRREVFIRATDLGSIELRVNDKRVNDVGPGKELLLTIGPPASPR